jgi:hypothetical protein
VKEHLKKLPKNVGKCPVCTINLYNTEKGEMPIIWPCGVINCPYKSREKGKVIADKK